MRVADTCDLNLQASVKVRCMRVDMEVFEMFCFCRTEARGIPDVMISPNYISPTPPHADERGGNGDLEIDVGGESSEGVTSGPAWIRQFMKEFLDLRLKLQRYTDLPNTLTLGD